MTRRGWGLLIAALATYLAARIFGVGELQMVAVALIVLVVAAIIRTVSGIRRLELRRVVTPTTLTFGDTAKVRVNINNLARVPTTPIELVDVVADGLGAPASVWMGSVPAWRSAVAHYQLEGRRRGVFTIGPAQLRTGDPFGIVERTAVFDPVATVTVLPEILPLGAGLVAGPATTGSSRGRRTDRRGTELAGVRDYVDGDDLRAIHWASTARRGQLIVRRNETPHHPSAVVFVDARASRHAGQGAQSSIETAVTCAASVAHHLIGHGQQVAVVDRPLERPPRPLPWDVMAVQLAKLALADVDVTTVVHQLGYGMAGNGILVAVVTTPDAAELRRLTRACRTFASANVLVIDAASFDDRGTQPHTPQAVAALRAAGIRAVAIRRDDDLVERWAQLVSEADRSAGVGTG